MKRNRKEISMIEWVGDAMEFLLKCTAVFLVLFSASLAVTGFIIIHKYDYMSFWEIFCMSEAEYDLEILRNNTLFIESYDGYTFVIMAMRYMLLSLAVFVLSRVWGATTRIKYLYRCHFGNDFKLDLS